MPFNIGLTGLNAASKDLEVTGHNVANASTAGFKESRAEFADIFANSYNGIAKTATGHGVRLAAVAQQFNQGSMEYTDNSLDMAIDGRGFFVLENPNGDREYTRAGQFQVNDEGLVVNSSGQRLQGYPPEGLGDIGDIQLTTGESEPQSTTRIDALMNLSSEAEPPLDADGALLAIDPQDPDTYNYSTSTTVYDSLGESHTVSLIFQRTDGEGNNWNVQAYLDGDTENPVGEEQTLTFNQDGTLASVGGEEGATDWALDLEGIDLADDAFFGEPAEDGEGGTNQITLDFGDSTQYGSDFSVTQLEQDGYAPGNLIGVNVESDGTVFARFTNGASRSLGQVALANFTNPQGLESIGGTNWRETGDSGDAVVGRAEEGSFGQIQGGAYENANVDISRELVDLITAQRNYQANAQVISAADTIAQTIINLR